MISYFKEKNHESKSRKKFYKTLTSKLESLNAVVIIGATTMTVTLSVTSFGSIVMPISAENICTLFLVNKLLHKIVLNKDKRYQNYMRKISKQLNFMIN